MVQFFGYYSIKWFSLELIIFECFRLWSINKSRLGLLSMLKIFEVDKNNFFMGTQRHASMACLGKRTVWFRILNDEVPSTHILCIDCIQNELQIYCWTNEHRFNFDLPKPKHQDFIYGYIKVVIQSYPIQRRVKF